MPMDEPSRGGLTISGRPSSSGTAITASRVWLLRRQPHPARRGQALGHPHALGHHLVHRDGAGHHAAAGVGDAHQFQRALHRAVFAVAAVQRDEDAGEALLAQRGQVLLGRVERVGVHPLAAVPPARRCRTSATRAARRCCRPSTRRPCPGTWLRCSLGPRNSCSSWPGTWAMEPAPMVISTSPRAPARAMARAARPRRPRRPGPPGRPPATRGPARGRRRRRWGLRRRVDLGQQHGVGPPITATKSSKQSRVRV
jgi:hypothetical protein